MSGSLPPGNMETDVPQPVSSSAVPGPSGQLPPQQGAIQSLPGLTHSSSPSRASKPKSSSALSRSEGVDWMATALLNNLNFANSEAEPEVEDEALQTLTAGIRYPRDLLDPKFLEWVTKSDNKRAVDFPALKVSGADWFGSISRDLFEGAGVDTYEAGWLRVVLYKAWDCLLRATRHASHVEMEQRHAMDSILRIAFESRLKACQVYRGEREMFLPSKPHTAIADVMIGIRLPVHWYKSMALPSTYVFTSIGVRLDYMVTFIVEYKKSSSAAPAAARQLALSLCSAQHSRRALGFDDGRLYGATLVGTILTMFYSVWEKDQVVVYQTTTTFDIQTFQVFLKCYIFLCKLADHVAVDAQAFFRKAETEEGKQKLRQVHQDAINRPWRLAEKPKERKRQRTDDGSAGGGGRAGGAKDEMDYEDWVPFEDSYQGPLPPGGDFLIERNLAALDKSNMIDLEVIRDPPAKNIRSWAEESLASGEHVM